MHFREILFRDKKQSTFFLGGGDLDPIFDPDMGFVHFV